MAPKPHILSVCVKQSTYQSQIFRSLHAKHSVTTDTGPDAGWDSARISPEEYSLQARVTVFNVGFCPFNALILSIVLWFSQLPIHRVSEGHVTLPHPLLAKHPAFSTSTLFTVFLSNFLSTHACYLAVHSNSISPTIIIRLLSLFPTRFPTSQCKQRVYCVTADLVCPQRWLFCLWESPWWIEITSISAMLASGCSYSLSLAFTKIQGYLVRCVSQFFCLYI